MAKGNRNLLSLRGEAEESTIDSLTLWAIISTEDGSTKVEAASKAWVVGLFPSASTANFISSSLVAEEWSKCALVQGF